MLPVLAVITTIPLSATMVVVGPGLVPAGSRTKIRVYLDDRPARAGEVSFTYTSEWRDEAGDSIGEKSVQGHGWLNTAIKLPPCTLNETAPR